MVGWQRQLQFVLHEARRRIEGSATISFNSYYHTRPSLLTADVPALQTQWRSFPTNVATPFQYIQRLGFTNSRTLLADSSDVTPVSSPLSSPVLQLGSGKPEDEKLVVKPSTVQAVLKGIKQSPKKVNLVAEFIRGMRVEDALMQLQVTAKRAAKTVYQVIHSARANATHNHGLDPDRLVVAEAFVGKGYFKKRISYHAKGRCGIIMVPECRLTVVVRETTAKEEARIAKLRVNRYKKLSKYEKRLVPFKLIKKTPYWNLKRKDQSQTSDNITAAC